MTKDTCIIPGDIGEPGSEKRIAAYASFYDTFGKDEISPCSVDISDFIASMLASSDKFVKEDVEDYVDYLEHL